MEAICEQCKKKLLCNTLCPEAELYANQDEVKLRELPIGQPEYGRSSSELELEPAHPELSISEIAVLVLYKNHFNIQQIAEVLKITRQTVAKTVKKLTQKSYIQR